MPAVKRIKNMSSSPAFKKRATIPDGTSAPADTNPHDRTVGEDVKKAHATQGAEAGSGHTKVTGPRRPKAAAYDDKSLTDKIAKDAKPSGSTLERKPATAAAKTIGDVKSPGAVKKAPRHAIGPKALKPATDERKDFSALQLTVSSPEAVVLSCLPHLPPGFQIPDRFCLRGVPYHPQEEYHYSAPACVAMLREFFGLPGLLSQNDIAELTGWDSWQTLQSGIVNGQLVRLLAPEGLLVARYMPQAFVAAKCADGIVAATLLRRHAYRLEEEDFCNFKALLLDIQTPLIVRLHLSPAQEFAMDEDMARKVDACGQWLLLVGWDEDGFIVHDPWDWERWGAHRGGPYSTIPYDWLRLHPFMDINCAMCAFRPRVQILHPTTACYEGCQFPLQVVVDCGTLRGFDALGAAVLHDCKVVVRLPKDCSTEEPLSKTAGDIAFGKCVSLSWNVQVDSAAQDVSLPFSVTVQGQIRISTYPWESKLRTEEHEVVITDHRRITFLSAAMVAEYGRLRV